VIPRRLWVVELAGQQHVFCDEGCERLYRDYWLTQGKDDAAPAQGTT
jgi:hypothetical protein